MRAPLSGRDAAWVTYSTPQAFRKERTCLSSLHEHQSCWNRRPRRSSLAVLHGHRAPADSLVIREIGKDARHTMGEAGVTRVLWRAGDPAELDSAEELLARQQVPYQRHRDEEVDGITMHDPDGLEIVLLWLGEKVPATGPPSWLYWYY